MSLPLGNTRKYNYITPQCCYSYKFINAYVHTCIMQLFIDIRQVVEHSLLVDCSKSVHIKLYPLIIAQMF